MIQTLEITNPSDDTLSLDLATSETDEGLIVFNQSGLGSPKATVSGVGGPNSDGIGVSSVRADARQIILTLAIPPSANVETSKQKIYTYFPVKKEIKYRVITDAKDVFIMARVESVVMNDFAKVQNAEITLYCPDPYFQDSTETNQVISSTGTTIAYGGEVATGCTIEISWSAQTTPRLITITNVNGTQALEIDLAAAMAAGPWGDFTGSDEVHINTYVGNKTIIFHDSGVERNFFNWHDLGDDDDFIQIYLGDNLIDWDMSDTSNVTVRVKFRELFEGV